MMLMKMLTYYIYRAPEVQKVQSFPITLFDGTGSMHKEYPRAVNAYKTVFGDLGKKKLEYQWTKDLNPLEPFRQAGSGNITNTFVTMFQMLLSEKAKFPKNITLVFISDGKEEFELEKITLFIERMKQKYLIQFISVAVGDQFPNSISNTLRSLIHNHDPTCPPLFQVTRSQTKSFQQIQQEFEAIFWEIRKRLFVSGELICINIPVYYTVSAKSSQNQVVANSLFLVEKNQKIVIDGKELQPTTDPTDVYQMILNSVQQAFISQGQTKFQDASQEFEQILNVCQDLLSQIDQSKLQEQNEDFKKNESKALSALKVAQQIAQGQLDLSNAKESDLTNLQDYLVNNVQKFTELATNLKKTQAKAPKPGIKSVKRVSQFITKTQESDRENTPQKKLVPKNKFTGSQKSLDQVEQHFPYEQENKKVNIEQETPTNKENESIEVEKQQDIEVQLDQVEIFPQQNDLKQLEVVDLQLNNILQVEVNNSQQEILNNDINLQAGNISNEQQSNEAENNDKNKAQEQNDGNKDDGKNLNNFLTDLNQQQQDETNKEDQDKLNQGNNDLNNNKDQQDSDKKQDGIENQSQNDGGVNNDGNDNLDQNNGENQDQSQNKDGNEGLNQNKDANEGLDQKKDSKEGLDQNNGDNLDQKNNKNGNERLDQNKDGNEGLDQNKDGNLGLDQNKDGNEGLDQCKGVNENQDQNLNDNDNKDQNKDDNQDQSQQQEQLNTMDDNLNDKDYKLEDDSLKNQNDGENQNDNQDNNENQQNDQTDLTNLQGQENNENLNQLESQINQIEDNKNANEEELNLESCQQDSQNNDNNQNNEKNSQDDTDQNGNQKSNLESSTQEIKIEQPLVVCEQAPENMLNAQINEKNLDDDDSQQNQIQNQDNSNLSNENSKQQNLTTIDLEQFIQSQTEDKNSFKVWNESMLFEMSPIKAICQKLDNQIIRKKEGWLLLEFTPITIQNGEFKLEKDERREYELVIKQFGNILITKPKIYDEETEFHIILFSRQQKKLQILKKGLDFKLTLSNNKDEDQQQIILTQSDFLTMLELIEYSLPRLMAWNQFCKNKFQ